MERAEHKTILELSGQYGLGLTEDLLLSLWFRIKMFKLLQELFGYFFHIGIVSFKTKLFIISQTYQIDGGGGQRVKKGCHKIGA